MLSDFGEREAQIRADAAAKERERVFAALFRNAEQMYGWTREETLDQFPRLAAIERGEHTEGKMPHNKHGMALSRIENMLDAALAWEDSQGPIVNHVHDIMKVVLDWHEHGCDMGIRYVRIREAVDALLKLDAEAPIE